MAHLKRFRLSTAGACSACADAAARAGVFDCLALSLRRCGELRSSLTASSREQCALLCDVELCQDVLCRDGVCSSAVVLCALVSMSLRVYDRVSKILRGCEINRSQVHDCSIHALMTDRRFAQTARYASLLGRACFDMPDRTAQAIKVTNEGTE